MEGKAGKKEGVQLSLFRQDAPKMPEGYYSGDKPNPNLRAFVEAHLKERPYDPEKDNYDIPAFDKPIETTKATAIYNMHSYWSKKPHDAIRQYIIHYTQPGNMVLDPFCGSGGTALAAVMEGRKAIAIDRSPAATFITKNYCTPVNVEDLRGTFEDLKEKVRSEIDWLYGTRCDRCNGKATTVYSVYSQVFECSRCLKKVPFFDCVEAQGQTARGTPKNVAACPYCYARGIVEEISTRGQRFGSVPVLVSCLCKNGCKPTRFERRHNDPDQKKRDYFNKFDLGKLRDIEGKDIPHWYPTHRMMHAPEDQLCWGAEWRPGRNFRSVDELFNKRNLWALAAIREAAGNSDHLLLALNAITLNSSKLYRHRTGGGGGSTGNYYIAQEHREMAVWPQFEDKVTEYLKSVLHFEPHVLISTQSATNQEMILTNSIDYIFTDPPYSDKVQFGEMNFIWEAWLGLDTHWHDEEIIVNEVRGKTEADWANMMREAMAECLRVLKPGRWISLCYHDTSEGTWALVQDVMAQVGFLVDKSDTALFIDTQQKSYNQLVADKVNKRDLVINFRKPKAGETNIQLAITGDEDEPTFNEKVCAIILAYLDANPGATKDRIYDEVVSQMVRSGRMEAHNFDELLSQVADQVHEPASRWYLKETALSLFDAAESAKEDEAADKMRSFIEKQLHDDPALEGVHYSDLWEYYVYAVKDRPRRKLAEWLPDYFYITDSGTYRPPISEEEERLKAEGRKKGTIRHIKRYLAFLEQGVAIPDRERPNDASLAEWIRHCKRSGLYEQGKALYEKGGLNLDSLPEEIMVDLEEDYQVCVRMLARTGPKRLIKKAKK